MQGVTLPYHLSKVYLSVTAINEVLSVSSYPVHCYLPCLFFISWVFCSKIPIPHLHGLSRNVCHGMTSQRWYLCGPALFSFHPVTSNPGWIMIYVPLSQGANPYKDKTFLFFKMKWGMLSFPLPPKVCDFPALPVPVTQQEVIGEVGYTRLEFQMSKIYLGTFVHLSDC